MAKSPYGAGSETLSKTKAIPPFWKAVSIETAFIWGTVNLIGTGKVGIIEATCMQDILPKHPCKYCAQQVPRGCDHEAGSHHLARDELEDEQIHIDANLISVRIRNGDLSF